jgi:DNA mismatch repair protein MutS2
MKITAKESEVRLVEDKGAARKGGSGGARPRQISRDAEIKLRGLGVSPEIDLRGMMADEAVAAAELYLDGARVAKLETVTIIHGKGTGALRAAIQAMLKQDPAVKAFRPGRYGEGENGVTVVELK